VPNINCAIVVPLYQEIPFLNRSEIKLISTISKVFPNRPIFLVIPKSLKNSWGTETSFNIEIFEDGFFHDKYSYSKLLCSKEFYNRFINFEFIQIIQQDCWVFDDKIDYFAGLGFDYIGAPWMVGGFEGKPEEKMWKVGNGGFSLRKTESFLQVLNEIKNGPKGKEVVFTDRLKGIFKFIKNLGFRNNLKHYLKKAPGEDIFWSIYVPEVFSNEDFKIADNQTAASYSFEVNPNFLFREVTQGQLPMGCHNWMNNNPSFWKEYINY
jgi:hypothetical protein